VTVDPITQLTAALSVELFKCIEIRTCQRSMLHSDAGTDMYINVFRIFVVGKINFMKCSLIYT